MADMRTIGTALEARAEDMKTFVGPMPPSTTTASYDWASLKPVSIAAVERILVPHYIKKLPREDGWGNEFDIRLRASSYGIRTRGKGGRADAANYAQRENTDFHDDIVFIDGNFIQHPGGL